MGMKEHPCSGHAVDVCEFRKHLSTEKAEQLDEFLDDSDRDELLEFIQDECKRMGFPPPCWMLFLDEESTPGDELERDHWYILFDDDALFVKTEKPEFVKLKKKGLVPVFANWSEWG